MKQLMFMFMLVLLSGLVLADQSCPSGFPIEYQGNIYVDDGFLGLGASELLVGEYSLIVKVGGSISGDQIVTDGSYSVDVSPCYGTGSGEIKFFVNGVEAEEVMGYSSAYFGKTIALNLTLRDQPPVDDVCGDGDYDGSEECDDANSADGDGCSSICELEYGYSCVGQPSVCTITEFCGDGIANNGETCSSCPTDAGICDDDDDDDTPSSSGASADPKADINLTTDSLDNSVDGDPLAINVLTNDNDSNDFSSTITGAVAGAMQKAGWAVMIIFVVLIVGGFVFVRSKNSKK